jgi:hypothetical protein
MTKPGRGRAQAAFAGVVAIDMLPAAALPMNRRITLLERFIAGSVSSRLCWCATNSAVVTGGKRVAEYSRARKDVQLSKL